MYVLQCSGTVLRSSLSRLRRCPRGCLHQTLIPFYGAQHKGDMDGIIWRPLDVRNHGLVPPQLLLCQLCSYCLRCCVSPVPLALLSVARGGGHILYHTGWF